MELRVRGCHPCRWPFQTIPLALQGSAGPRSLATTNGVSVDFLSSGYLDVSVPRVRSFNPMDSGQKYLSQPQIINCRPFPATRQTGQGPARSVCLRSREDTQTVNNRRLSGGFPHSDIPGSKGALASPGLIAECHVLHRLLLPRHPPNALLALDPIRKKTGPFVWSLACATALRACLQCLQPIPMAPVSEVLTRWRPSAGAPRFGDPNGLAARRTSRSVY